MESAEEKIGVTVLFFARARDLAGRQAMALTVPRGATVQAAVRRLGEEVPALAPLLKIARIALDEEFAAGGEPLTDGSVLAVIPPVSGG